MLFFGLNLTGRVVLFRIIGLVLVFKLFCITALEHGVENNVLQPLIISSDNYNIHMLN